MMSQITTEVDVEDFLRGANFMSASGGGEPAIEREHLLADVRAGRQIGWRSLDELPDDAVLACCCYSGSIAPESFDDPTERAVALGGGPRLERPFVEAARMLTAHLGVELGGLISVEIGGINAGAILGAAAASGVPLADADYAGRAIPELPSTGLAMHGVDVLPFAMVDHFGNEILISRSPSLGWIERIAKQAALSSLGLIACAFAALPVRRAREIAVPGTMSECLALGRSIRRAREAGEDPVAAAAAALDGWVLFRGTVRDRDWVNNGYMEGTHVLAGTGDFAGHALRVWFRNENHVTWLDDEPWAASPDLIEFCDPATAEPLVNTYLELGQEIAVVGRRRRDQFDSADGLEVMGPRHWGFDVEFRGLEALVA
jgi:uncharacterized protein